MLKARILLKADVSEAGDGWSDSRIVRALDTSQATVFRTRQRLVEEGFEGVLGRKHSPNSARRQIFDGAGGQVDRPDVFARAESTGEVDLTSPGR
jgi:hypothetical protein